MAYTPKVGDRVGMTWGGNDYAITVTHVGKRWMLGEEDGGQEVAYLVDQDWQLAPPPPVKVREWWVRIGAQHQSMFWHATQASAEEERNHPGVGGTVTQLRVTDGRLILCDEAGEPMAVEAVES